MYQCHQSQLIFELSAEASSPWWTYSTAGSVCPCWISSRLQLTGEIPCFKYWLTGNYVNWYDLAAGFSLLKGWVVVPPHYLKICLSSPLGKIPPVDFLTKFCPPPPLTIFILTLLFVHTVYANFDFNQFSIFTECCF